MKYIQDSESGRCLLQPKVVTEKNVESIDLPFNILNIFVFDSLDLFCFWLVY